MARAFLWALGCLLSLFPENPHLLAQTSAFQETSPPQGQAPGTPSRGVFLPCGATSAAEAAHMRLRVELPPVPAYPSNGDIPEDLEHRHVYLNEETGELVLTFVPYPDFEGTDPEQEIVGNRVVEKAPLGISSCPSLSAAIYQPGDPLTQGYVYRYRLDNLPQARQTIGQLLLPVPLSQQDIPLFDLVRPHGWGVDDWELPAARVEKRSKAMSYSWGEDYRQEMRLSMFRRRINWHAQLTEYVLSQGDTLQPFGFTTEALPGIVRAYVVGSPTLISRKSSWPDDLIDQLSAFDFGENNSLSISTIGPKFSPDADKSVIASDFLSSLEELIRTKELAGESPFIQKVPRLLETVAGGGAVGAADWPSGPETDFEAEILMAMRVSLGE